MMCAILSDFFQRVLSINEWERRRNLSNRFWNLNLISGSMGLDYGFCTGLFAGLKK